MNQDEETFTGMELKNYLRAKHIADLLLKGKSYTEIAKTMKVDRTTLYDIMNKPKVKRRIIDEFTKHEEAIHYDIIKRSILMKKYRQIERAKNKFSATTNNSEKKLINFSKIIRSRNAKIKREKKTHYEKIYIRIRTQKKHMFDLTLDYLLELAEKQNHRCALTGIPFNTIRTKDKNHNALLPSVDRINSDIGYIPSNVQWVTIWANRAKLNYSTEFFNEMCKQAGQYIQAS